MVDHDAAAAQGAGGPLAPLLHDLRTLRECLAATAFPLATPGSEAARELTARLVHQLDDYLLPRVAASGAPLLAVVGGSTGAGKSTLVNSLLNQRVTEPGVLRPTTRSPVLVCNPADKQWFTGNRILPGLARDGRDPATSVRLESAAAQPEGLALLDAPDVDSVVEENRNLAGQLLAAADLWLFATTAARYADAVPWDLLNEAARRHTQVALILGRVDPGAEAVAEDLRRMLTEQGLGNAPIFLIPEGLDADGLLPGKVIEPLKEWLTHLAGDAEARSRVVETTRDGVIDDVVVRTGELATALGEQDAGRTRLEHLAQAAFDRGRKSIDDATSDGTMLRGEVLARWQDFVGTSEFFRAVEQRIGRVRDAVTGFFRGGARQQAVPAQQAISHGLETVIVDAIQSAAQEAHRAWRADPAGAQLLDADTFPDTSRLRPLIAEQIRGWQGDVLALVGEQAAGRRGRARALSLGVNGLGVSLMIVVFASTGGLTGAEVGIAGGTALLAQRVLEGVFGEDAVRRLTKIAHTRLSERVDALLASELDVFLTPLAHIALPTAPQQLLDAASAVQAQARTQRDNGRDGTETELTR